MIIKITNLTHEGEANQCCVEDGQAKDKAKDKADKRGQGQGQGLPMEADRGQGRSSEDKTKDFEAKDKAIEQTLEAKDKAKDMPSSLRRGQGHTFCPRGRP